MGELPPVLANSGVGERPARAPSATRWAGRKRGGEGDEDWRPSEETGPGGEDGFVVTDCCSSVLSREGVSLRFL